jgi:hypothetical protein
LLEDESEPGVYVTFADGEIANHFTFSNSNRMTLMLQLFYDGLGTTNPLRGQSSLHNIGVLYYTVKNLPAKHSSCFANVHLLALCYAEDLKVYGFDPILQKIVDEMNQLQQSGIEVDMHDRGRMPVYSSLCQVTCDNLALNGMLGFVESFACDYFCTICYVTQETIQTCFRCEMFEK